MRAPVRPSRVLATLTALLLAASIAAPGALAAQPTNTKVVGINVAPPLVRPVGHRASLPAACGQPALPVPNWRSPASPRPGMM